MEHNIWEKNLMAIDKKLPGWRTYIEEEKYRLSKEEGRAAYIEDV